MADNKIFENGDGERLGAFADAEDALDAQIAAGQRLGRARGRPKGALNRKSAEFETWYREQGYKDPVVAQAEWLTADPVALQAWFEKHERAVKALGKGVARELPGLMDIIKLQLDVADRLMPYLYGKKPIKVEVPDEMLPMLVLNFGTNQLAQAQDIASKRALSVGQPVEIDGNKINDLDGVLSNEN